ncbi:MAG TPA: oligosaccharide flippase family protein [Steroidobacteraceae bacterium]|nr:oligosaccharide flippase family protein [Steroidobacteraceae bacterium]
MRQRLLSGTSWQVGLALAGRLFTFLLNVLQGRYLGVAGYGQLSLVQSTLQFLTLFAGAATGNTSMKYLSELRASQPERVQRILAFSIGIVVLGSLAVGGLLALWASPIAIHILHQPSMTPLLRLSSVALIAICIGGTWGGVLFGFQMFRTESIIRFVQAFAWFASCVALMLWAGVWGAVLAYDLACVLSVALLCWFGIKALRKHKLRLDFRNAMQERRVFRDYSLAVIMTTAVTLGSQYAVFALLSRSADGAIASGRFFAAFQYRLVIQYVPMMIQATAGPIVAELLGAGQRERAGRLYYTILGATSLSLAGFSLVMVAFSGWLLGLFGRGFHGSPLLFASVMAYAATVAGNNLASMALQMHGKPWIAFRADATAAVVILIAAFVLVGPYQDVGAALALQIGALAQAVVYMASTRDVGPMARQRVGSFRYAILVLLAPQMCMLLAIARSGIRNPGLWLLGSAGLMALLLWSGVGWYRQFKARAAFGV